MATSSSTPGLAIENGLDDLDVWVISCAAVGPAARSGSEDRTGPAISGGGRRPHLTRERKFFTDRAWDICLTPIDG